MIIALIVLAILVLIAASWAALHCATWEIDER
jgi:hypothetical protein